MGNPAPFHTNQWIQHQKISMFRSLELGCKELVIEAKRKTGIRKAQELVRDIDGGYFIFE